MLSGIKRFKRPADTEPPIEPPPRCHETTTTSPNQPPHDSIELKPNENHKDTKTKEPISLYSENQRAAEELRASLLKDEQKDTNDPKPNEKEDVWSRYERRHVNDTIPSMKDQEGLQKRVVWKEDHSTYHDKDISIQQMISEETHSKRFPNTPSMDERHVQNIVRLKSNYRNTEFQSSQSGFDEDEELPTNMVQANSSKRQRLSNRELEYTKHCWWWMESGSFRKDLLISLGNHLSLLLVPRHLALVEGQCVVVPMKPVESFLSCDNEVWEELDTFQRCLRAMFHKQKKGVLFLETVWNGNSFWQARMECVPVPYTIEEDAVLYFKQSLAEQASELTNTHRLQILTHSKPLRNAILKSLPYFYVGWSPKIHKTCTGYVHIIESFFPKDFGIDTIAGMMELECVKFRRKDKIRNNPKEEWKNVKEFLVMWKPHDWTLELD